MRRLLVLAALASLACGQTTAGNDAGPDGEALDVITSGCSMGTSNDVPYDASACVPQLKSTFSCNGSICSWNVIIPCEADAGDAGDAGEGGIDCNVCKDVQPAGPHSAPSGFCQPGFTNDAGTTISCGGCGV